MHGDAKAPLKPTEGHILAGAQIDEHRILARVKGSQLFQIAPAPSQASMSAPPSECLPILDRLPGGSCPEPVGQGSAQGHRQPYNAAVGDEGDRESTRAARWRLEGMDGGASQLTDSDKTAPHQPTRRKYAA